MNLYIAEKPSIGKAIATELGIVKREEGYIDCKNNNTVTWCFGHMLELANPDHYLPDDIPKSEKTGKKYWRLEDLPIIPEKWIKFEKKDCKEQLKVIKALISKADVVVNCGDPDREGQLLVDEVISHFSFKGNCLRYWTSAMDPESVRKALDNLKSNSEFYNWGIAAQARSEADWLIGMNLTRKLTLENKDSGLLISVGRVQSPVLKLIVSRDLAIKNFKAQDFYDVKATFSSNSNNYVGTWKIPNELLDPAFNKLLKEDLAKECIKRNEKANATVSFYEQKLKKNSPKLLYTLSTLQVDCSSKYGFSAQKTLDIAQALYEKYKLTSYPRTSCPYLPTSQKNDVARILNNLKTSFPELTKFIEKANPNRESKLWNDEEVNKEAHTGLAPTTLSIAKEEIEKQLANDEKLVYELICKRYLSNFLDDYVFQETKIETTTEHNDVFSSCYKTTVNAGWKELLDPTKIDKDVAVALKKGDAVLIDKIELHAGKTVPPSHFTEGTIIEAMRNIAKYIDDPEEKKILKDDDGIGTEATRASIIEVLKNRGYIENVKGKLLSTTIGQEVINIIPTTLQSASLTAQTERNLFKIQQSQLNLEDFIKNQIELLKNKYLIECNKTLSIKSANKKVSKYQIEKCPKCGGDTYRNESKTKKGSFSWRCSKCKNYFQDENGKIGQEFVTCPNCSKFIFRYKDKFKENSFVWYCKNCGSKYQDVNGKIGEIIKK